MGRRRPEAAAVLGAARAVVVDTADGQTVGTSVYEYPSGERGIIVDPRDPHLARQHPADYVEALRGATIGALERADGAEGFSRDRVIGIGVDTTGSTPMPADENVVPLALKPEWKYEPAAMAWLIRKYASFL